MARDLESASIDAGKTTVVPLSIYDRLKSLGPGLVYVLTVMGAGDIVSNSAAGAEYQYALIWALAVTLILRYVWVSTSAKYVLVTGETLIQGYSRLGGWITWVILTALVIFRHFYNLYLIVLMGTTWDLLFHLPTKWSSSIWSVVFTLVGFVVMTWGGYRFIEYFCKVVVAVKGISLVISAAMSHPHPAAILKGTLVPTVPGSTGLYSALLVLMALIGTEAGSMTNLTYPYFMYEKGWRNISFRKVQQLDLGIGVACIFIMGALLQIAAAGTLHPLGIKLEGPEQLVKIFSQTQGVAGLVIFALGLWGAAFSSYVGATIGYGLILTDICRKFVPAFKKNSTAERSQEETKKDPIYRWAIALWVFSPLYIVFVHARPVWLVLTVSSMVIVVIPVLAFALLRITNDKKLMGEYKNGWFTNLILVLLLVISLYFTWVNASVAYHSLARFFLLAG
jgi:Mn2+/Fe2+ NRAMP family transporter